MSEEIEQPDGTLPVEETDRHTTLEESSDVREYVMDDNIENDAVVLPAGIKSAIDTLSESIDDLDADDLKNNFTEKELRNSGITIQSRNLANDKDINAKTMKDTDAWVNDINYSDKKINLSHVKLKAKGELSGNAALAKFGSKLALGSYTTVPLWHSGITVTIRPPYDSDLVTLENELAGNEIKLGRDTSTLVYSNYSVVYDRILADFIVGHITNYSVDLPNDVSLLDIISVHDYYPLLLGLLSSMHPTGYTFIKSCLNTLKIADGKPLCDFSATGTVNPMNMLRVNRKSLTTKMLKHMSNKRPNSVSLDEVKEYQLSINELQHKEVELVTGNGDTIKLTLKVPSIGEHIDNGEAWINTVIDKSEKLFTEADNNDRKNKKMNDTLNAVILGIYNVWITKVEASDGDYITDRDVIYSVLDMMSTDDKLLVKYIDAVKDYIEETSIAIVGTPVFTCPKCEKVQEGSEVEAFKEFIPLNALEHFFDLTTLRLSKVTSRVV